MSLPSRALRAFDTWSRLWDRRELPTIQALVRILLGTVLLTDLGQIAWLDLTLPILGPAEAGGLSAGLARANPPWWFDVFPPDPTSAWMLWAALVASCVCFTLGLGTRTSALVLLVLSAQAAMILPPADRAIDRLIRNTLMVLLFASAGRTLSVDARLRTGSWLGDGEPVPAWPRHLIVLQLVVMYATAGIYKVSYLWTPMGHFDALYVILQDPAVARFDWSWLVYQPFLTLTRIGTAVTVAWEWSAPLVVLVYWWRFRGATTGIPGWAVRRRLHLWWIAVGVAFHVLIAVTLDLGIFPFAMLALYPTFVHPDELAAAGTGLRARLPRPAIHR